MNHSIKQTVRGSAMTTLIGGVVIVLAVLFLLVKLAGSGYYSDVDASTPTAIETRILPQGGVVVGDGTPVGQRGGEQIFNKVCIQCHAADGNVPDAPRITRNNEWTARIAKGFDTLFHNALNGFNAMPAKGGQADLTDDELKRTIAYMVNQSGGNFKAPEIQSGEEAVGGTSENTAAADGKKVFEGLCMACHAADSVIPGVPRITRNDEWKERIAKGKEVLFKNAINGFTGPNGLMPARGGNPNLSDEEVKAAVIYMANQSGGKF
ncbi:MAG: c-type cytochrome [Neisseria sp.]|nr:c-type cytochrome [Neisseria sp.]